jgi:hypothetical protein
LRAKIGPGETEAAGFGEPRVKANNEVWTDFRRNPSGRANFPDLFVARRLHMLDMRTPRASTSEKLAPGAACLIFDDTP